jgi:hypothetical protein
MCEADVRILPSSLVLVWMPTGSVLVAHCYRFIYNNFYRINPRLCYSEVRRLSFDTRSELRTRVCLLQEAPTLRVIRMEQISDVV